MSKEKVLLLARELFKIRIGSSNEGESQDDGMHKLTVKGITSYSRETIEKWYQEAIETAEFIIAIEEKYLEDAS